MRTTLRRGHLGQTLECVLAVTYADLYADPKACTEDTLRSGRTPGRTCTAGPIGSAGTALHHDHQHPVENVRIQFLNGADPLNPCVVDQDLHLELEAPRPPGR